VELVKARIDAVAAAVRNERGTDFDYRLGVMVETPRAACARARSRSMCRIPQLRHQRPDADDLWAVARRCGRFMSAYVQQGVFPEDPFHLLDPTGWASC
jgi:pyruvate,orthophosphate dikinase